MKKTPRAFMYVVGIPLAYIWLLTYITRTGWLLWGLVIIGVAIYIGMLSVIVQNSTTDPYQQYVRAHNKKAQEEVARIAAEKKLRESETVLIETSDD